MQDVNLTIASEVRYFLNQWELDYLNLTDGESSPNPNGNCDPNPNLN
jgi:hypothetical protein